MFSAHPKQLIRIVVEHIGNFFFPDAYGYISANSIIMKSIEKSSENEELATRATDQSPINWAVQNGELAIKGRSATDDVGPYLQQLRENVDAYIKEPNSSTKLTINLEYLNGITSHYLYGLIRKLYYSCHDLQVIWEYRAGDDYSLEQGQILASICKAKFRFVKV